MVVLILVACTDCKFPSAVRHRDGPLSPVARTGRFFVRPDQNKKPPNGGFNPGGPGRTRTDTPRRT